MEFIILTIFPKIFTSYFQESLMAKAIKKKLIQIQIKNIRDFTTNKHQQVDDQPYGGGPGMVMKIEPIYNCLKKLALIKEGQALTKAGIKKKKNNKIILLDPRGRQFNQQKVKVYAKLDQLILICGRYEGIDERVKTFVDEVISIGPYILNGGEVAALTIIESTSRLIKGFVGDPHSLREETFNYSKHQFDFPHYTRPAVFQAGKKKYKVPMVLLSGNHQRIKKWREKNLLTLA